ncbi:MAG TPA: ATP-binding protein [Bacteroidales bacterium]|nr:ATP-binding protein [Bacteroidales bacterium]
MEKTISSTIKRIVLIGPESTGKTELAQFLSKKLDTVFVPEYAREYIENLNRKYTYNDVVHIAETQINLSKRFINQANKVLFYDTYLIITKIWFKVVFNTYPSWIDKELTDNPIDLFLLCNTDIEWLPDAVRENGGEMREKLFEMYKQEIESFGFKYEIVKGVGEERFQNALEIVTNFLNH